MISRGAGSAKRRGTGGAGQRLVPVDYPGAGFQQQALELIALGGNQSAGETKTGGVSHRDRLREIVIAPHAQQRAKDFFIRHLLHVAHVDDPRRQQRSAVAQQTRLQ